MKLCRFDHDHLGLVRGDELLDVTGILKGMPAVRWPLPPGDALIANLAELRGPIEDLAARAEPRSLRGLRLESPVANPSKIIGAPLNYKKHVDEANADQEIALGRTFKSIEHYGLFLKSSSGLCGPSEGVTLRFPDRRSDHEIELAVIIGKPASHVSRDAALEHVAGYAIGLDMTVRGTEDRSLRKSLDSYSVLGPWIVTPDEIPDPDHLDFSLQVNGQTRQASNTRHLIFDVRRLIEYASQFYTLHPGDILMTGTPEGVGPVDAGDIMRAEIEGIGAMEVHVRQEKLRT